MKSNAISRALVLTLLCGLAACDDPDEDVASSKAEVADEAGSGGKADGVDICASWDWYDDDFCDDPYDWCMQPDPDCGPDGDSCAEGWTWSGRADEGCVPEQSSRPLTFAEPEVIGSRGLSSTESRAWAGVAIDRDGDVHAAYVNIGTRPVYARLSEGWAPHVLGDANTFIREGVSIDADVDVHVAYVDSALQLNHVVIADGEVVDSNVVDSPAYSVGLALGPHQPHVVFGSGDTRPRLSGRSGDFAQGAAQAISQLENVTEAPEAPAVVVDDGGIVHTVYGTQPAAFNLHASSELRYGRRDASGVWSDELVARATRDGGAVAVAGDGSVSAVYRAFFEGQQTLMFAERGDDGWETQPLLGPGIPGRSAAIAASADGVLHLVYRSSANEVHYMSRTVQGEWSPARVLDASARMSSADRISIALGADEAVHIVYTDSETRDVRYVAGR